MAPRQALDFRQGVVNALGIKRFTLREEGILSSKTRSDADSRNMKSRKNGEGSAVQFSIMRSMNVAVPSNGGAMAPKSAARIRLISADWGRAD